MTVQTEYWQTATEDPVVVRTADHPLRKDILLVEAKWRGVSAELSYLKHWWVDGKAQEWLLIEVANHEASRRIQALTPKCSCCGAPDMVEAHQYWNMNRDRKASQEAIGEQVREELGLPTRKGGRRK